MEQISVGHRYKECRPRRSSSCPTKLLVGKDVLKELEQRRSSPSVIAKLMGIDVLPPTYVANNRHQEFKDVFEVSEEPPEAVTKERSHPFPKGLPSLKRSAMRFKRLMPSKSPYGDGTFDNDLEYRNGIHHLNSLEIDNPLFEKRPHDVNYSLNHQHERDTASTFRKYPVGLANSSLRDIRNSSRQDYGGFNDIVVLEPGLRNCHDQENSFSMPFFPDVNKNSRRDKKQKQAEFAVMSNQRVSQHFLDAEDVNLARIKKERHFTVNAINPLSKGQEPSFDQFNMADLNSTGSSQRYASGDVNYRKNNMSSSNSLRWKIFRKYEQGDVGSKTLAEMFALSDSERVRRNPDSHAQVEQNKLDQGTGHSKEGCFIVLPTHAPPLPIHSSLDKSSSGGGSPYSENFSNISCNSSKFHFDSLRAKPSLKQIARDSQSNMRNASIVKNIALEQWGPASSSPSLDESRSHSWRLADNISASDCINEKVLFATDEDLVLEPAETVTSAFHSPLSKERKVSAMPFQRHDYDSITISNPVDAPKACKSSEEFQQPSPVSILEPPTDEDSYCSGFFKPALQDMPNVRNRISNCRLRDEPEVSTSSDDDNDSSYQSLEAFQVEEDRDFSYLLEILISSGMIVADWQLLCKSWYSPGFPVGPQVFDRLERKYNKVTTWSKPERLLLFDLANSVLSDVLAPCTDMHPWVSSRRQCSPIWGPEGPVEKVWQMMVRQQAELGIGHPDDKVLDPNWLEVGDDINMVGKQIARMLYADLLGEVVTEFIAGSVVSPRSNSQPPMYH